MPNHRTPDTCSGCQVELHDLNWFPGDRRKSKKMCKRCTTQAYKARRQENPQYWRDATRASNWKLRLGVLAAYGNACQCCGETEQAFLTIDHVNNDGKQHRAAVRGGSNGVYRWLRDRGYPKDGFQLLCRNCNWAKYTEGQCPHSIARQQIII